MTFLDELRAATQSNAAAWLTFALAHISGADEWYLFVEGELDVSFYQSAVRQAVGMDVLTKTFKCGGRDSVIEAKNQIAKSHPKCNRCLFFVDKDLRDYSGKDLNIDAQTYCTDWYSIENYIVGERALEVVWTELWGLSNSEPRWQSVKSQFLASHVQFSRRMLPLMAWILVAQKGGRRPNVNNVNMRRLIEVRDDLSVVRIPSPVETLKRECSCALDGSSLEDVLRAAKSLRAADPKTFVRGKFELWFFVRFLSRLDEALRQIAGVAPRRALPLTVDAVAAILIGRLPIADSLRSFLQRAMLGSTHACA